MKMIGEKLKMTQFWDDKGSVVPVTPIKYVMPKEGEELPMKEGDHIKVRAKTKGRGFQGVVKRHGFGGGPQTHGQKNRLRAPGSIGSTAPQRVWPGRRMAGHMGTNWVSVKNLLVVKINKENGTVMLKGAVPGPIGGKVELHVSA